MNEHIKSLAKQVGFFADDQYPGGFPNESVAALEEFSKLLIEECIRELSDAYDMTTEEGNYLRDYFGFSDDE